MLTRAATNDDLDRVRELCWEFRDLLFAQSKGRESIVAHYYPEPVYKDLMSRLPRIHAPPHGAIYVVDLDGAIVGCAMIRRITPETCEVKRLYIAPQARRRGAARKLMLFAMDDARSRGYRRIVLDTLVWLKDAVALYENLGFGEIAPYHDLPETYRAQVHFLGRDL